jgi:hypothetical protein
LYDLEQIPLLFELGGFSILEKEICTEMKEKWENSKSEVIKCLVNVLIRSFNPSNSQEKYKTAIIQFVKGNFFHYFFHKRIIPQQKFIFNSNIFKYNRSKFFKKKDDFILKFFFLCNSSK